MSKRLEIPGPWTTEPTRLAWADEATGLPCVMLRQSELGHWCGYVGVPPTHRLHSKSYDEAQDGCDVHGGLTFSDNGEILNCDPAFTAFWWFGFDCAHAGDLIPRIDHHHDGRNVYRDAAYVKQETEKLAAQLFEIDKRSRVAASN